ncbi:hypothetical protein [Mumia quercus]|uniref:hypothetical protein n=1 Tax=Mumia quercus TaxID=2976125 RepID=UPI0021D1336E|nr:hypothetical protein [Mumia quercus]
MTESFAAATSLLAEAARFFVRHYPIVFAFGALASVQRFVSVSRYDVPLLTGISGELITMAVRIAFAVWVVRAVLRDRPDPPTTSAGTLGIVLASTAYLVLMTLVFKVGLDLIGSRLVAEAHQTTYTSWELALKNVTVIPFVLVWMVILVVALVSRPATDHASPPTVTLEQPSPDRPAER